VSRLPAARFGGSALPIQAAVNDSGRSRPARVLVADDHQPLLDRVAALLACEFSVIGTVTGGAELVEADAALHPDVVVVDISMPGMSGLEATTRMRSRGSQSAIVYLTAHDDDEIVEAAWAAGALGYVIKTSMAQDLVPAVRAALAGQQFVSGRVASPDLRTT
jgi:DNA-binding NarL/FixJ family response regulator